MYSFNAPPHVTFYFILLLSWELKFLQLEYIQHFVEVPLADGLPTGMLQESTIN